MDSQAASPRPGHTLLRAGAAVLSAGDIRRDVQLELVGDRIASITRAQGLTPMEASTVLTPGLVNAHAHLELGALHGAVPAEGGFLAWVAALMARRDPLDGLVLDVGTRASADEALRSGTTTILDIDSMGRTRQALRGHPLRAVIHAELIDGSPGEPSPRTEGALELAHSVLGAPRDARRAPGLSPHGSHTVGDHLMARVGELRSRSTPVAVHWAETPEETEWLLKGTGPFASWLGPSPGISGVERLGRAGLLQGVALIHGNHPANGEIERLVGTDVTVVHCPGSHLFFGREPFDAAAYRRVGVNLALGTDSAASNARIDMRREMRLARQTLGLGAAEVWRMATENGARLAPWPEVTGRLEVGAAADVLRLQGPEGGEAQAARGPANQGLLEWLVEAEPEVLGSWIQGEAVPLSEDGPRA